MDKFNRGNRFNNRDSGRPQMHHAVCANCGKDCEVPFRPTNDRPVYCSDCFKDMGGQASAGLKAGILESQVLIRKECFRRYAPTAEKIVKYRFSQALENPFIAMIVLEKAMARQARGPSNLLVNPRDSLTQ